MLTVVDRSLRYIRHPGETGTILTRDRSVKQLLGSRHPIDRESRPSVVGRQTSRRWRTPRHGEQTNSLFLLEFSPAKPVSPRLLVIYNIPKRCPVSGSSIRGLGARYGKVVGYERYVSPAFRLLMRAPEHGHGRRSREHLHSYTPRGEKKSLSANDARECTRTALVVRG